MSCGEPGGEPPKQAAAKSRVCMMCGYLGASSPFLPSSVTTSPQPPASADTKQTTVIQLVTTPEALALVCATFSKA